MNRMSRVSKSYQALRLAIQAYYYEYGRKKTADFDGEKDLSFDIIFVTHKIDWIGTRGW
jgi:hypothetical protein